jgi:hypothetical protein
MPRLAPRARTARLSVSGRLGDFDMFGGRRRTGSLSGTEAPHQHHRHWTGVSKLRTLRTLVFLPTGFLYTRNLHKPRFAIPEERTKRVAKWAQKICCS